MIRISCDHCKRDITDLEHKFSYESNKNGSIALCPSCNLIFLGWLWGGSDESNDHVLDKLGGDLAS